MQVPQMNLKTQSIGWRRRATKRGAGISISLGGELLDHAGMLNLTEVEIVLVDGGGLFIRAPGASAPTARGLAPADREVESQGSDGGLF